MLARSLPGIAPQSAAMSVIVRKDQANRLVGRPPGTFSDVAARNPGKPPAILLSCYGFAGACRVVRQSSFVFLLLSRTRAFVIGAFVCAVVSATASAFVYRHERAVLLEREGARLEHLARRAAHTIDARLNGWLRDVVALAEFAPFQRQPLDVTAVRDTLEMLRRRSPSFSWIGLVDSDGRVVAATRAMLEGQRVDGRPWYAAGRQGHHIGDVHAAVLLGQMLPPEEGGAGAYFLDAAAPVRRPDGQVVGVLAGHMNWQWVRTLREEMLGAAPYRGSLDLVIADRNGRVLLEGDGEGAPAASSLPPPLDHNAGWSLHAPEDGPAFIVGATRTAGVEAGGLGWSVHARRRVTEVVAPADDLLAWLTFGCMMIALAGGATAAVASHMVSHALRQLAGHASGVSTEESLAWVSQRLADLQSEAHRDGLTGLLNRAGFAAWHQAYPRPEDDAQLIALDLNGFKPVNDRHGHGVGDEVLVALGGWLRDHVRAGDAAVRLGGDEFVICLPGAPRVVAERFVAQLRRFLDGGVDTSAGRLPLGCGVGLTTVAAIGRTMDDALRSADVALYGDKRQGAWPPVEFRAAALG